MASSRILVAKRALVSVILALAHAYKLVADINRDSDDVSILKLGIGVWKLLRLRVGMGP